MATHPTGADPTLSAIGIARAKPDQVTELACVLGDLTARASIEPGCIYSTVYQNLEDPLEFVFYESWRSSDDLARHLEQPHMREFLAGRMHYLAKDLEVRQLGTIRISPPEGPGPSPMNQLYLDAYQARDVDAIMALYAPGAASVWAPGESVTGDDHRKMLAGFLAREPQLVAEVRASYVVGDVAALVTDWRLDVPGAPEMSGTGCGLDVLRRGPDGQWRYIITNPFGAI